MPTTACNTAALVAQLLAGKYGSQAGHWAHLLRGVARAAGQLLEILHVTRQAPWQAAPCSHAARQLELTWLRAAGQRWNSGGWIIATAAGTEAASPRALTLADAPALGSSHHNLEGAPSRRHACCQLHHPSPPSCSEQWSGIERRWRPGGGGGGGGQERLLAVSGRREGLCVLPSSHMCTQARRSSPVRPAGCSKVRWVQCSAWSRLAVICVCCWSAADWLGRCGHRSSPVPRWQAPCRNQMGRRPRCGTSASDQEDDQPISRPGAGLKRTSAEPPALFKQPGTPPRTPASRTDRVITSTRRHGVGAEQIYR